MREAASAFGDATVFLERYVTPAHHVEVQVFGDTHGNVIHLLDRECSVQRRHQKVVEECPAPGLTDKVRDDIRAAAVSLASSIGYVGAGTVEFVVSGHGNAQQFFFLEMNTRLQVEHPVTELVTGTDLVAWQFAVAIGRTLPLTQEQVEQRGNAVEVRLYAEDPAHDWMPGHGRLFEFRAPATPKLRVDTGVAAGDDITTFYDPMLAKVVAHAPSRAQAVAMLAAGLRRFTLHGPVTNREALVAVLEHEAFRAGDTPTSFFEDHPEVLVRSFDTDTHQAHLIAATHHVLLDEQHDSRIPFAPAGWRNIPTPGSVTTLAVGDTSASVNVRLLADGSREWSIDGSVVEAHVVAESPEHIFVTVNGVRRSISIAAHGASLFCDDGLHSTHVNVVPRFTASDLDAAGGGPTTPVPGTITAVLVAVGDRVEAGDALVVLEAMKMEHRIKSDVTGTISALYVNVGENVDSHHLVAEVTADEAQEDGETA
jgi:acetyl/propionyl-CoA carboxylase alpha subunit